MFTKRHSANVGHFSVRTPPVATSSANLPTNRLTKCPHSTALSYSSPLGKCTMKCRENFESVDESRSTMCLRSMVMLYVFLSSIFSSDMNSVRSFSLLWELMFGFAFFVYSRSVSLEHNAGFAIGVKK